MDFIALFQDFGYPALVTGVLLWMIATKLEKLTTRIEKMNDIIQGLRDDLRDAKGGVK